jgi:transposase
MQLVQVEEAFRNLKGDLAIRPIYHPLESRIDAHLFVTFLALLPAGDAGAPAQGLRAG